MHCYNVICKTETGDTISVGVMTSDKNAAMKSAEYSVAEGQYLKVSAIDAIEVEAI